MKIVNITHPSRPGMIVTQGLLNLGFPFASSEEFSSASGILKEPDRQIVSRLSEADIIFFDCFASAQVDGDSPIVGSERKRFAKIFRELDLWDRVLVYDFRDDWTIDDRLGRARRYFKRSITKNREWISEIGKVRPIQYCVLDEMCCERSSRRHFSVGCFFNSTGWIGGERRAQMLRELLRHQHRFPNNLIGSTTGSIGEQRRRSISAGMGPYVRYRRLLCDTKIVFTAEPGDVEGDNRVWEAIAAGALVFRDVSRLMSVCPNPLIDGIHCIEFDASSSSGILEAIERAAFYLANETQRAEIAMNGLDFALKFHRPRNRVMQMVEETGIFRKLAEGQLPQN